ncbi:MAG: diaminopimelate epimerase [Deltaproteobacteria bacterium]|nr:diaminopimelate epimerase [Deltaproteobacteria bacterium]
MKFVKMNGTGNDFILIDNLSGHLTGPSSKIHRLSSAQTSVRGEGGSRSWPDLARVWCHRRDGVGADGLIVLRSSSEGDFGWDFFNSDGSEAEMCGNGARCAIAYYLSLRASPPERAVTLETRAGLVRGWRTVRGIEVEMPKPSRCLPREVELYDRSMEVWYVNTGVPHVVLLGPVEDEAEWTKKARVIRFHVTFAPDGANVNQIQRLDSQSVAITTYERGVEGITSACGTGAVAGALVAHLEYGTSSPVRMVNRGGDLWIHFRVSKKNPHDFDGVALEGSVEVTTEGFLY